MSKFKFKQEGCIDGERQFEKAMPQKQVSGDIALTFARIWKIIIPLNSVNVYPRDIVSAVYATATWLAGCLSVIRRYCIKMAKPILKLFRPSGSPIILVSSDHAPIPNSKGNPFRRALHYLQGVGKIGDFRRNRRLSQKRCEIGRWLLWNDNRKLWVPDWMVSFSMTLSDP